MYLGTYIHIINGLTDFSFQLEELVVVMKKSWMVFSTVCMETGKYWL